MLVEVWKDIKGYEGLYQVSNLGRIKSLSREVRSCGKFIRRKKERILKNFNVVGYKYISLSKNSKDKTTRVHALVWDAFGDKPSDGHKLVVDHIDEIKTNNRIDNLQLLSHRDNIAKYYKSVGVKDHYPGVTWSEERKKWCVKIYFNRKQIGIGRFFTKSSAILAHKKTKIEYGIPI